MIIDTTGQSRRQCGHAGGQSRCAPRHAQDADRRAVQDRHRLELRCGQRRVPLGEADRRAEHRRPDRRQGPRHGERGCRAQGGRQDLSRLPDLSAAAATGRKAPTIRAATSCTCRCRMLCIDATARTDREAAPQFVYNTTNVGKFAAGKDKVGRIDAISVETGQHGVELGDESGELFADPGDRRRAACSTARWTATCARSMPTTAKCCGRRGFPRKWLGGTITFSVSGRQYIAVAAGGGAIAALERGHDARSRHDRRQQRDVRVRAAAVADFASQANREHPCSRFALLRDKHRRAAELSCARQSDPFGSVLLAHRAGAIPKPFGSYTSIGTGA